MQSSWDITGFWNAIQSVQEELRTNIMAGNVVPAYTWVGQALQRSRIDIVHEVTSDDTDAILVFTPESDPKVAREIDMLLAAAPRMNGWKIFGRRQRQEVEDALRMTEEVYDVDLRDARFIVTSLQTGGLEITMFTAAAREFESAAAAGLATFFLEHAIGEMLLMQTVRSARLEPLDDALGSSIGASELFEMVESQISHQSKIR
ncbi:hypothetical protein IPV69_11215 [Humisphaera borealis]|uniref:Uncharacterized protein n=2 Tax=Humisphaera borealis TaxID=2807512 RepID=A0A7M2X512_9BACT|nr:hypothetical protein IPV69_11215 [Humisphaera borealis]